jgi:hypothetical protein
MRNTAAFLFSCAKILHLGPVLRIFWDIATSLKIASLLLQVTNNTISIYNREMTNNTISIYIKEMTNNTISNKEMTDNTISIYNKEMTNNTIPFYDRGMASDGHEEIIC